MRKKLGIITVTFISLVLSISGCSLNKSNKEIEEIAILHKQLNNEAVNCIDKYFDKTLDLNQVETSLAQEVEENKFSVVTDAQTSNKIYLSGHIKGEPTDIVDFSLVYDNKNKKPLKIGISTVDNEKVNYIEIK